MRSNRRDVPSLFSSRRTEPVLSICRRKVPEDIVILREQSNSHTYCKTSATEESHPINLIRFRSTNIPHPNLHLTRSRHSLFLRVSSSSEAYREHRKKELKQWLHRGYFFCLPFFKGAELRSNRRDVSPFFQGSRVA